MSTFFGNKIITGPYTRVITSPLGGERLWPEDAIFYNLIYASSHDRPADKNIRFWAMSDDEALDFAQKLVNSQPMWKTRVREDGTGRLVKWHWEMTSSSSAST